MDNYEVAKILDTIARILELQGENPFKVRAYSNASRTIEGQTADVARLIADGTLGDLPGIGEAIRAKIVELVTTGRLEFYEELRRDVPAGVLGMLEVPSLGPKKIRTLWKELGITSVDELRQACLDNRLLELKGFGEKTQQKILEGIALRARHQGQYLLSAALPLARTLLAGLRACPQVARAEIAGSLRRWKEVVRDVDLVASSAEPAAVSAHFLASPGIAEVLGSGGTKTSVRMQNGLQVDLRVVSDEQFPYALQHFTGSKEHNVQVRSLAQKKGLKVNEYGIFRGEELVRCRDEAEFYAALGLPCVPPEMREGAGELDLEKPPALLERSALEGTFHMHSTWSDGTASIEDMAVKARSMGFSYIGFSDHSAAAAYARGLDVARLRRQMDEIDALNRKWSDFRILKGLECDILPDGNLDLTPEILAELDFVIGSIHSQFGMSEKEMTDRVCRAMAHPNFDILGHSTGRLLLQREGYKIDLERVIDCAKAHGKFIELNANPNRLDLDAPHCRRAKEKGVLVAINPDAHSISGLEDIDYGIGTARRGWLEPKDVLNTRTADEVLALFRHGRRAGTPGPGSRGC